MTAGNDQTPWHMSVVLALMPVFVVGVLLVAAPSVASAPETSAQPPSADVPSAAVSDATALAQAASKAADAAAALSTHDAGTSTAAGKPTTDVTVAAQTILDLRKSAEALDDALNEYAGSLRTLASDVPCPPDVTAAGDCDAFTQGVKATADEASRAFVSTPVLVQSRAIAQNADALASSLSEADSPGDTALATLANDVQSVAHQANDLATAIDQAASAATASPPAQAGTARTLTWVSALLIVALWLGALAESLVRQRPTFTNDATPPVRALFACLKPGFVVTGAQALLVAAAAQVALRLPPGPALGMAAFLLVTGFAFSTVNQGLIRCLGWGGALIAFVLAVVAGVDVWGDLPGIFGAAHGVWPTGAAVDAVRGIATSAVLNVGSLVKLVCWLVAGAAAASFGLGRHLRRSS